MTDGNAKPLETAQATSEPARAKVNLDLLVTARRPDGYHELDSLVVFADIGDTVTVEAADDIEFSMTGPFAASVDVDDADNLVTRAARLLKSFTRFEGGARITLEKNLPVAAGLGGGSADAAACIRALNRLWKTGRSEFVLRELSLELGADLPVCMFNGPARMRGLGERVDPIRKLPALPLVLVNPNKPLSTASVFKALEIGEAQHRPRGFPVHPSVVQLSAWLGHTRNDLEAPAQQLMPEIGTILDAIRAEEDCLLARLSGSGPTCFGLFADRQRCARAANGLRAKFENYWIREAIA